MESVKGADLRESCFVIPTVSQAKRQIRLIWPLYL